MKLIKAIFTSLLILISCSAFAQTKTSYLCATSQSIGYALASNGRWEMTKFNNSDVIKYMVRYENSDWSWTKFGESTYFPCNKPVLTTGDVVCTQGFGQFVFNYQKMRFLRTYTAGYVHGDEPGDTPSITIGKCSPL